MYGAILPEVGQLVFTSDDFELGRVKEVTDSSFKIDVPLGPDVWLPNKTVESRDRGVLHLNVASLLIGQVKLRNEAV